MRAYGHLDEAGCLDVQILSLYYNHVSSPVSYFAVVSLSKREFATHRYETPCSLCYYNKGEMVM